mmetsp:Transcript_13004/g.36884  ORF Transcript_13004/g.36884 Transcript_13004/m.36884 type:complete len:267 (+) Transcript_13004:241-1041(+)
MRKRRKQYDPNELKNMAEQFLARMEVAAEKDASLLQERKPAVFKLRMLGDVEHILGRKGLHVDLLDSGLLGVLKAWLEPVRAKLPNVRIRTTLLDALTAMDLQLADEDRRDSLKASGLGKIINFYSKCPDETPANQKLSANLVQKWSRQIFDQYRPMREREGREEAPAPRARASGLAPRQAEADLLAKKKELQPGDRGYRYHAAVPQPVAMDYRFRPESKVSESHVYNVAQKEKEQKFEKRLAAMSKRAQKYERLINPSVEGRGIK